METGRLIVLVDDSADEAAFVRRALARRCPGVELQVFRKGSDAVAYLLDGDPAVRLVLLDLKLPGLGGHAVLRALRERHGPGELPVVIFSSSREPSDLRGAYRLGANSYVVKPLIHEDYLETVGMVARYWLDANHLQPAVAGHDDV